MTARIPIPARVYYEDHERVWCSECEQVLPIKDPCSCWCKAIGCEEYAETREGWCVAHALHWGDDA